MGEIQINSTNNYCTNLHSHCGHLPCHVLPNMRAGKCEMHNFSVIAMDNFLRNMTRESVPIDQQINNLRKAEKRQTKPIKSQLSH